MFRKNDEQYLLRAISANRCVLFLGARFSSLANNRNGERMPSARQLAAATSRLSAAPLGKSLSSRRHS
jgi:hypothetical protein